MNNEQMSGMSFLSQNMQSLNISSKNVKTDLKIKLVTKAQHDFVFMSDTRLNTVSNTYGKGDIAKKAGFYGYDSFFNSPGSSRGVGILIKKNLGVTILDTRADVIGNYLLLKVKLNGSQNSIIIGSVYGPNTNEMGFFDGLENSLAGLNAQTVILGGDWNLTYESVPANENIDVINMREIPSRTRSLRLKQISTRFNLTDPYRVLHPNKRDFTYVPNDNRLTNRSRLDFFLVSTNFAESVQTCQISPSNVKSIFDHKSITCSNRKPFKRPTKILKNEILTCPEVLNRVKASIFEFYIHHTDENVFPNFLRRETLENIGLIAMKLRDINKKKFRVARGDGTGTENEDISRLRDEIDFIFRNIPDIDFFNDLEINCSPDVFFESLVMTVRDETLNEQARFFRIRNCRKTNLQREISNLKTDYENNRNLIFEKENELSLVIENEIRDEISSIKSFETMNNERMTPFFLKMAKSSSKPPDLDSVCDDTGTEFENCDLRGQYITDFYKKLYEDPSKGREITERDILDFLGPCANEPEVIASKLNDDEKENLDTPILITEFDSAIKDTKKIHLRE